MSTTPVPSPFDLMRIAARVRQGYFDRYDGAGKQEDKFDKAFGLFSDIDHALQDLATATRAITLQDVAAQLVVAFILTDDVDSGQHEKVVEAAGVRLRRIVLGALPVVASAAGVDLSELGADYLLGYADHEFPPLAVDAAPAPEPAPPELPMRW